MLIFKLLCHETIFDTNLRIFGVLFPGLDSYLRTKKFANKAVLVLKLRRPADRVTGVKSRDTSVARNTNMRYGW